MNKVNLLVLFIITAIFTSCNEKKIQISSPDQNIHVNIENIDNQLSYDVIFDGKIVVQRSLLGFKIDEEISDLNQFKIEGFDLTSHNDPWKMVWGERDSVENIYNQGVVQLVDIQNSQRKLDLVFKVYNDGLGFRYEFMEWTDSLVISDELTEFNLNTNDTCWWIPADYDCYEHLYSKTLLGDIDATKYLDNGLAASSILNVKAVNTPITIKNHKNIFVSIHEANLTNYAGMTLALNESADGFVSELVPSPNGYKAKVELPFNTPWRTIQISENAGGLIESPLIVNLNEPNKIEDVSWITPMKYIGIWWDMHINRKSWDYGSKDKNTNRLIPHGNHGATTKYAKELIDFASKHNIGGVLIEGWNTGWEDWVGEEREGIFDFVTPYPDFDIHEVTNYAKEKGVEIVGHHETSAAVTTYEQQIDTAFRFYKSLGIDAIKTGYVGKIYPKGEYHHGQWMVNHYHRVAVKAAQEKIMIDAHEPIKATGIRRTLPNFMTREGMRGQEFNAWTAGNPPEHLVELPFTRMLAGPLDYTSGIFDITLDKYKPDNRVHSTLANQLALYVVLYSPLQMAADLISNYENNPAFEFIDNVPVSWDETKVLDAEIGDYIIIARRKGSNWFIGAITDENPRKLKITIDFIEDNNSIKVFNDARETSFYENPTAISIEEFQISKSDEITISMTSGGGFAAIISEKDNSEVLNVQQFNELSLAKFENFKKQRKYGD
jgi:glucan 1,4-alpha-glucosidase